MRHEAWRRTSGVHRLRGRRALGAARALWEARDAIAAERDVTPGRILPDSAIVAAATALPGRPARPAEHAGLPRSRREPLRHHLGGRDPACPRDARGRPAVPRAARRRAAPPAHVGRPRPGRRPALQGRPRGDAQPRRAQPPAGREPPHPRLRAPPDVVSPRRPGSLPTWPTAVRAQLTSYGARPWQVELVSGALVGAILPGRRRAGGRARARARTRGLTPGVTPSGTRSPTGSRAPLLRREDRPGGLVDLLGR